MPDPIRHAARPLVLAAVLATLVAVPVLVRVVDPGPRSSVALRPRPPVVLPSAWTRAVPVPDDPPGGLRGVALGAADGEVADGTTPFGHVPAVTRLDPALLAALRDAAVDAARDAVRLEVNSGWRSRAYQARLFERAVATYGSASEAARWVARPGTSVHEAGDAVDVGPSSAASWLGGHGAAFGLCRVYANEPWHVELRPDAVRDGCPAPYADPTQDPRTQR